MGRRTVAVASGVGLHARPASIFTQAVLASAVPVRVGRPGGRDVDGASILGVMGLAVKHGEEVELTAEGPRADEVLDGLVALLARDLDAD